MKRVTAVILFFCCALLCRAGADAKLILVSIAPLMEPVQKIAGPDFTVKPLVPPGMQVEHFSPNRESLKDISSCALFFGLGLPWEKPLMNRIPALKNKHADVSRNVQKLPWAEEGHGHLHGKDPHIWLSIPAAVGMSTVIAEELSARLPAPGGYSGRAAEYTAALQKLHAELTESLRPLKGRKILVYHPSFAYFFNDYGMMQTAVEKHGHEATGAHLQQLLKLAKQEDFRSVFVQPQFNPRQAKTLSRELQLPVFTLDPLPSRLSEGLRAITDTLLKAHGN